MNNKVYIALVLGSCLLLTAATAEVRTYRQVKDVAVKENGKISQSADKDDLFECSYEVDPAQKTITRVKIRRLDKSAVTQDKTIYNIMQRQALIGSDAGNGGKVLVAIRQDGGEMLELGHRFAFTMRVSPFSQVISGVYKRIYSDNDNHRFQRHHQH